MATTKPTNPNWRCILAYLTTSLAHCQCGFSTTSISGFQAMVGFLSIYGHLDPSTKTGWNMGVTLQQLAASFVNFGTMLGILCAKPIGRYFGRRHGLWLACVISVLGSGLQLKSSNVAGLYARRIIIGMSNGLFMMFANSYTVESAPSHLKERIVSLFAVWFCAGSVLGAVTNNFTQHLRSSWAYKIPLTCHITIPSFLVILVAFIPESPRWLVAHGNLDTARHSLIVLRGHNVSPDILQKELLEIRINIEAQHESNQTGQYLKIWKYPSRRRTILCIAVILSNSSSGIWLMLSYGTVFFQLGNVKHPFQASIYNNLANLLGAILGLYLCKRVRRRTMMMAGHFIPAVCMLGVAVSFAVDPNSQSTGTIVLACIIIHGFSYYSFSSVLSSTLCREIVNSPYRGLTIRIGAAINYITAWLIAFTMPYFINTRELNWGPKVAYIWAASNIITSVFFFFFLPETKGCTHEEIQKIFQNRKSAWRLEEHKKGRLPQPT